MTHKRSSPRLQMSFPVLVESSGDVKRQMAENVSELGMLVVAREPYPVGTLLRVTFSLPATDVELAAEAEVRHVTWVDDANEGHFRIGLHFRDFDQGELHPPLRCLPC